MWKGCIVEGVWSDECCVGRMYGEELEREGCVILWGVVLRIH